MKKSVLILLLFAGSSLLKGQSVNIREFIVADAKTACIYNNAITSCLKIKFHPDSNWKEFPYTIKGFIHEPGVEVRLLAEEKLLEFPDEDSMMIAYKLIKVVETRKTVLDDIALLRNNRWKVINLEQDLKVTPAKRAGAFMVFNPDSNLISGFGGCNGFGGNALMDNGVIQFGEINQTLLSCSNDELETRIMSGLKGKAAFYVRNNMLFLVCENLMTIHLRPEKKLDSVIMVLQKPVRQKQGSSFMDMKNGHFSVAVDLGDGSPISNMMFGSEKLTPAEAKTIRHKLKNLNPNDPIAVVHILKTPHQMEGLYYATLIMKDGSRKSVIMRHDH